MAQDDYDGPSCGYAIYGLPADCTCGLNPGEPMTPARFVECRETIGWPRRHLARLLGCSENVLRQMEAREQAIPGELASWLEKLARHHAKHPPPIEWRARPENSR